MITANEARELAGPNARELMESLEPFIKAAASDKKRHLRTGYVDKLPHRDFWVNGGYKPDPKWLEAKELLESNGYKVSFFYEERQFVDMYTLIEW